MDWICFRFINGLPGRWALADGLMRLLANDYGVTTVMSLGMVALWFEGRERAERERNQRAVLLGVLSLLAANLLLKVCNLIYFRPRPFAAHPVNLLFYYPSDSSLPSNAATVGFALAVSVWLGHRRAGWAFVIMALLWGFARVYCGVHYPGDVLAGALLGGGVAYALARTSRRLELLLALALRLARALYLA